MKFGNRTKYIVKYSNIFPGKYIFLSYYLLAARGVSLLKMYVNVSYGSLIKVSTFLIVFPQSIKSGRNDLCTILRAFISKLQSF